MIKPIYNLVHLSLFTLGVDFDGTVVEHNYPDIGIDCPGAFKTLRKAQDAGMRLILYTMRSDEYLMKAVQHCADRGINFWSVNSNPEQEKWTSSPKVHCHLYIDDAALGTPLEPSMNSDHPRVVWTNIERYLDRIIQRAQKNGGYYEPIEPELRNMILQGY